MISLERIDFISAYCDRWCERCAFTLRCSTYAVEVATAMCDGDVRAGPELVFIARFGAATNSGTARDSTTTPCRTNGMDRRKSR